MLGSASAKDDWLYVYTTVKTLRFISSNSSNSSGSSSIFTGRNVDRKMTQADTAVKRNKCLAITFSIQCTDTVH